MQNIGGHCLCYKLQVIFWPDNIVSLFPSLSIRILGETKYEDWEYEYYFNIWRFVVSDKATFVYVNIFVRSFSKIDDVKMVGILILGSCFLK